jgi:hypothetical protein
MNRLTTLFAVLALAFVVPSLAETIYKWEDGSGQIHYSDMPREGALEMTVQDVQTYSSPGSPASSRSSSSGGDEADSPGYDSLVIVSPGVEETIWNTGGIVTVNWALKPNLQSGHNLRVYLDGTALPTVPQSATGGLTLQEVERGSHTLRTEVVDPSGTTVVESNEVTFFYQQTSVN